MTEKQRPEQNPQKSKRRDCTQGLRIGERGRTERTRTGAHQGYKRQDLTKAGTCPRCQGLMVQDYFMDSFDLSRLWGSGWRCINCGAMIDSVIISHQEYSHPKKKTSRAPRLPRKCLPRNDSLLA